MSGHFKEKLLTFLRHGDSQKPHLSGFGLCICVLGTVARLLLSEKLKCNVAIWAKIKVRSSCMYLFTIER